MESAIQLALYTSGGIATALFLSFLFSLFGMIRTEGMANDMDIVLICCGVFWPLTLVCLAIGAVIFVFVKLVTFPVKWGQSLRKAWRMDQ